MIESAGLDEQWSWQVEQWRYGRRSRQLVGKLGMSTGGAVTVWTWATGSSRHEQGGECVLGHGEFEEAVGLPCT